MLLPLQINQPMEIYVDDEAKLTLHGLKQHYVKLGEEEKNRKLFDLLDVLEFNQVSLTFLPASWLFRMFLNLFNILTHGVVFANAHVNSGFRLSFLSRL